ncbi:hypothetical protein D917_05610, partial [Trichinella nativa]
MRQSQQAAQYTIFILCFFPTYFFQTQINKNWSTLVKAEAVYQAGKLILSFKFSSLTTEWKTLSNARRTLTASASLANHRVNKSRHISNVRQLWSSTSRLLSKTNVRQ